MADWDYIECGYNAADETLNFGTRNIAAFDNLYESSTLASIKNTQDVEIKKNLIVKSQIVNGNIFFSIDKTIKSFSDLHCSSLGFNVHFDDVIDVFAVTSDAQYLLIGLRNGLVCCFHVDTEAKVFMENVTEGEHCDEPCFVAAFSEHQSFCLVAKNGKVYRIETEDIQPVNEDAENQIKFKYDVLTDINNSIDAATCNHPCLCMVSKETFYIYNMITKKLCYEDVCEVKRIFFCDSHLLLALNHEGYLVNVCSKTFWMYQAGSETAFEDVAVTNSGNELCIFTVTKPNEVGDKYLQSMSYPDYTVIFSIKISQTVHLISPEHTNDDVIYISEIAAQEIRFQMVCETSPEDRFRRLLKRKHFNEAEQFAKLFQLDFCEVQKAKAQALVDKTVCDERDIENLVEIFKSIDDDIFKVQSCVALKSCCSTLEGVGKILNYGCSITSKKVFQSTILEMSYRFNAFMALVKAGRSRNTVLDWDEFSTCDLLEEVCVALDHESIDEAIIIYSHLDSTSIFALNESHNISNILNILNNMQMEDQFRFLNIFVPLSLSYLPACLDVLLEWIIGKVRQMELKHTENFPEIGIYFMKKMIRLLKVEPPFSTEYQQQCIASPSNTQQLTDLLAALERLQCLKNDYSLVIPLQQFLQQRETLIATLLNQIIDLPGNEDILQDFIKKFIFTSNSQLDMVFYNVVEDVTKYAEEHWIKVVPTILNCIPSVDLKLEAVLMVLKSANVPWDPIIREIAHQSLQCSHPLVEDILQEIEYEPKSVVLKKGAYQLTRKHIDTMEHLKHTINRIIYLNQPTMVEDIFQLCKDPTERHEAVLILVNAFIREGKIIEALDLIENDRQYTTILDMSLLVLNDKHFSKTPLFDHYYEMIRAITMRLSAKAAGSEKFYIEERFKAIEGKYKLQQHFQMSVTVSQLQNTNKKAKITEDVILLIYNDLESSNDLVTCIQNCEKAATWLGLDRNEVLLKLCSLVEDFNVILAIAERLSSRDVDTFYLCQMVVAILKLLGSSKTLLRTATENFEESFIQPSDILDVNIFTKGLRLANKIIVKAILNCKGSELNTCRELAGWIQTTYCLTSENRQNKLTFSRYTYHPELVSSTVSVYTAVRIFFQLNEKMVGFLTTRQLSQTCNHPRLNEMELQKDIDVLHGIVKCVYIEGHALTVFKLLTKLQSSLLGLNMNSSIVEDVETIRQNCIKQLLHNIFTARYIDSHLAYNLLLTCDSTYVKHFLFKMLKVYKRNPVKLKESTRIFLRYLQHKQIEEDQSFCRTILHKIKWWEKIKSCQIPYDQFFKKPAAKLIQCLITLNHLNISSLNEFCDDFTLDVNLHYEYYLKNLLVNWKPKYIIRTTNLGIKSLIMKNSEDELIEKCLEVINCMPNKETVYQIIDSVRNNVNFYHYEVFLCILHILNLIHSEVDTSQKKLMLLFLKTYTRVNKPGTAEVEEWYTLYPDTQSIEPLSECRVAFTPTLFTSKIWNIIRPEVNLKTYTKWFETVPILKKLLSRDSICSYVTKDIIASGVFSKKQGEEWLLHAQHTDLLAEIDDCIKNMSNLEQATSGIYCLTANIPGGADLVNAIKLCYKYAQEYQKSSTQSQEVEKAVTKVKQKYLHYSATHILYINKLADRKYLDMISDSFDDLIEALYRDERILKRAAYVVSHCPDINKAADELADLYEVNIQKKRMALLNQWLFNSSIDNFNLSVMSTPTKRHIKQDGCSTNIIRASYMCTSNTPFWRKELLKLGDVNANETQNLSYKVNALKCFCNISDVDTVENLTGTTYEEFRNFINKLMLMSNLECLGFSLNIGTVDKYNKSELLTQLACHIANPIAVKAMACVCITYTLFKIKYWNVIIDAMLHLKMMQELKECIYFLKKHAEFYNKNFFIKAWQAIIDNSFKVAVNVPEQERRDIFIDGFYRIQSCPVLHTLNLECAVNACIKCKQYNFAALGIQYLEKDKQAMYFKKIMDYDPNVYSKIEELSQFGFWGLQSIKDALMNQTAND